MDVRTSFMATVGIWAWIMVALAEAKKEGNGGGGNEAGEDQGDDSAGIPGGMDHKDLEQVYMSVMMLKALVSLVLMFVHPVIQVKGFFLAVINTLINVAKFIIKLKDWFKGPHEGSGGIVTGPNFAYKRVGTAPHWPIGH